MNLLFICKHNQFRSKVAEALFRHYYKGEKVKTKSAGLITDFRFPYTGRGVMQVMRAKGISIRDDGARKLDSFLLKWADNVIIVADDVVPGMFRNKEMIQGKKVIIWPVKDVSERDIPGIERKVNEIERNIIDLVKIIDSA